MQRSHIGALRAPASGSAAARRAPAPPTALFSKKRAVVEEAPPPPPAKKGLFGFGGGKAAAAPAAPAKGRAAAAPAAKKLDKADEYKKRQGFGGILGSFDLAEVRSKSDAVLLYEAKYEAKKGAKMTTEQAAALRRKVGGTAKDYWKSWIEPQGEYVDKGYVSDDEAGPAIPALPFLVAVTAGVLAATYFVVSATS
jgi:hypothetical protein